MPSSVFVGILRAAPFACLAYLELYVPPSRNCAATTYVHSQSHSPTPDLSLESQLLLHLGDKLATSASSLFHFFF